jgi:integrase
LREKFTHIEGEALTVAKRKRDTRLYRRGSKWWCRVDPISGSRVSTGCTDVEAAELWIAKRERVAANPEHQAAQSATLEEWLRRFLASKLRLSKATQSYWEVKVAQVNRVLACVKLSDVTPAAIDAYVAHRRTEFVADITISKEISAVVAAMRLAKRAGCYPGDLQALAPEAGSLDTSYRPRQRALTADEVVRLMQQLTPRWAAFVAVCVALGDRRSEAWSLRREDIDWDRNVIHIRGTKTNGADRVLPILSPFRELLRSVEEHLPIGELHSQHRVLRRACAAAGIDHCSPNDLRRTHATLLGERGVPDELVARLLGHTTTSMAKRVYNRAKAERLAPVVEAILEKAEPVSFSYTIGTAPSARTRIPAPPAGVEPATNGLGNRPARCSDTRSTCADGSQPVTVGVVEERSVTVSRTDSAHSPAALALVLAFESVLARRRAA